MHVRSTSCVFPASPVPACAVEGRRAPTAVPRYCLALRGGCTGAATAFALAATTCAKPASSVGDMRGGFRARALGLDQDERDGAQSMEGRPEWTLNTRNS